MREDHILLDERLRAWGAQQRATAPTVAIPVDTFARRRRRPLGAVVAAAAAVAAIAVGVSVLRSGGPRGSTSSTGALASAPPGYRAVTFHGLTINVPSAWPLKAATCGEPTEDAVVLPVAVVALCGAPGNAKLTMVEFSEGSDHTAQDVDVPTTTSTTISGTPAKKITGETKNGGHVIRFEVPAVDASVTVASPNRGSADGLAASLRIVQRDRNGCPAKATDVSVLPTGRAPARSGAATAMLPDEPTRVTVCRYEAALIEQSSTLEATQQARLQSVLNGLPSGLAAMGGSGPQCRRTVTDRGSTTGPDAGDSEAYQVQADYSVGRPVVVIIRLALCREIGASNGTVTGKPTKQLSDLLESIAGMTQMPLT